MRRPFNPTVTAQPEGVQPDGTEFTMIPGESLDQDFWLCSGYRKQQKVRVEKSPRREAVIRC